MTGARGLVYSLVFGPLMASAASCGGEPCECRADVTVSTAASPPADLAPTPPSAPPAAAVSAPIADSPGAALALKTLGELWAGSYAPVRALMTDELRADLTEAKLAGIIHGLVRTHGAMVQVFDAWTGTIREKDEVMPTAQVHLKMADGVRLGLMLVFDPQGAVKGLWLRPI